MARIARTPVSPTVQVGGMRGSPRANKLVAPSSTIKADPTIGLAV
jgi:hypothetical protein